METVVIVAIGVLATIFLASFIALVMVCRHRYCHPLSILHHFDSKSVFQRIWGWEGTSAHGPNVDLIGAMETQSEPSELELDDVVITNPHIEAILENEDWIEDASGLVSHCISILKICHTLTEKLVAMTMGSGAKVKTPASLSDIITVAKRISPRVDDVVRSMYPPLDPILLDARATALLLSVSHLVLVTRNACHMSGSMDWIDQSLHAAEDHMVVLREAALASEPERSLPGIDMQREQAI
ncbi:transmembrane protein 98 isoform X1 [Osmerus eperlanus]|uniref:transmembrane protein 98 isoform X1 n=1 Tax=Osmerus eperlanus TaxID=29151 RepID=UPI002E118FA5